MTLDLIGSKGGGPVLSGLPGLQKCAMGDILLLRETTGMLRCGQQRSVLIVADPVQKSHFNVHRYRIEHSAVS
jgi:hypothetical protein